MTRSTVLSFLYPQLITARDSKHNQEVKVYKFTGKYFVSVDKLTQSGGLVTKIWQKVIDHTTKNTFKHTSPKNILILGLGAGSAVKNITETWPKTKITGIEIDPVMIDMGRHYFDLDKYQQLKIIIQDAFKWLDKNKIQFDLILVDMYQGREVPKAGETQKFLSSIKTHLSGKGVAVFNRLSINENKQKNHSFVNMLNQELSSVERIKTPVNQVYLAKA